jgi:hypothetical protein
MTKRQPPGENMQYHTESRLSVKEAAKVMGLSESGLNKNRIFGKGPVFEKLGRSVRYRYGTLLDYMGAQTRRSTSDAA